MSDSGPDIAGRTVVITGATSGLGLAAATALAADGARIVMVGRSPERMTDRAARIEAETGAPAIDTVVGDLASLASVAHAVDELHDRLDGIDVLVNNAGGVYGIRRRESVDGIEMTMAVNHFGHFALTLGLIDLLRAAAPARIINVTSDAHVWARDGFGTDTWPANSGYRLHRQYGLAKLANILFTRELARRLDPAVVTANCTTPDGLTATGFAKNINLVSRAVMSLLGLFARSPEDGASGIVELARSPARTGHSGGYYVETELTDPAPTALDDEAAAALWRVSVDQTGRDLDGQAPPTSS